MRIFLLLFLLLSSSSWADTALDAAKEAAMIQTGVSDMILKTQKWGEQEALRHAEKWGIAPIATPVVFVHRILTTRSVNFPIGRERIYLDLSSIRVEIPL